MTEFLNKTIISHFYNEEYLLPWFLNHHKRYFTHGIMVDYNSTDNSVDIIKDICPTWEIIKSRNSDFNARACDNEIKDIEQTISSGCKMCLNVTEFFIGNIDKDFKNTDVVYVQSYGMVDKINDIIHPKHNECLIKQRYYGVSYKNREILSMCQRCIHTKPYMDYKVGRHFYKKQEHTSKNAIILKYNLSPFNNFFKKRILQIQTRVPSSDIKGGKGVQHILTENELETKFLKYSQFAEDLRPVIKQYYPW